MSFSIILSIGKYGGFYIQNGNAMKRLCFGFVALTIVVPEFDEIFHKIIERASP